MAKRTPTPADWLQERLSERPRSFAEWQVETMRALHIDARSSLLVKAETRRLALLASLIEPPPN